MPKNTSNSSGRYTSWALVFLCLLILTIGGSFVWKLVTFLQKGSFDSTHQYNLLVTGEKTQLISFNPDQMSTIVINVPDSQVPVGKTLEVPIDAQVRQESTDVGEILFASIMHPNGSLTFSDALKLWWFSHMLPKDAITVSDLPSDPNTALQKIPRLMQDKTLYAEGKSITIVNAAGVSGLGNRLARLLTNSGANVIMVSTAQDNADHSSLIYNGDSSYTLSRIGEILHLTPAVADHPSNVSDMTITIGKDLSNSEIF